MILKSLTPQRVVLDTNVVLDLIVFADPRVRLLSDAIQAQRVEVVTYAPALEELRHVLTYSQFKLDAPEQKELFDLYQSRAVVAKMPDAFSLQHLLLPAKFPRCRDRDDQHFLALAHHAAVDALISKDKDVLKLKRRAAKFGVKIFTVAEFTQTLA